MKSILITGSAGFIATHLAEFYLKKGYVVIGLDNYVTGSQENTIYLRSNYKNFHFFQFDITTPWKDLPQLTSNNVELLFHFASPASVKSYQKMPIETMWANSTGLYNAIQFADTKKARVIFSSTSEIYGSTKEISQTESNWGHVNSYGIRSCYDESKRFGEALIFSMNKINKTTHGLVRIFNTYGPRMHLNDDRVINTFAIKALNNEDLVVYGDGRQTRSFCYIDDLINGIDSYAHSEYCGPINIGNSSEISIIDLAHLLIKSTNSTSKIIFKPLPTDDPPKRKPDLSLAKKILNYEAKIQLEEGLEKFILHLKQTSDMK